MNNLKTLILIFISITSCAKDANIEPSNSTSINDNVVIDRSIDTLTFWLKLDNWVNIGGNNYQQDETLPDFGYSVEFQVRNNCNNPTEIISDHQLYSGQTTELAITTNACLYIGAVWWFNADYCSNGQIPFEIGFYETQEANTLIWPNSPIQLCPTNCGAGFCWLETTIPIKYKQIQEGLYYADEDSLINSPVYELFEIENN